MAERWILTPTGGVPIVLPTTCRNGGARVVEQRTPPPPTTVQWAPRRDGQVPASRRAENREVTLKLTLERPRDAWADQTHQFGAAPDEAESDGTLLGWTGTVRRASNDGSPLPPMISDLAAAVAALRAGGGTLTRVLDSNDRVVFDVVDATDSGPEWDTDYYLGAETDIDLTLTCAPYARGPERLVATAARGDQANRRFVRVDGIAVPGDVPALARIVVKSRTNTPQDTLIYGLDQATGQLEWPGSTLAGPGVVPSAFAATPLGSLGAPQILPSMGALTALSRQIVLLRDRATLAPLPLAGTYRVYARVFLPAETTFSQALRLRWAPGRADGAATLNATWQPPSTVAGWYLADLGLVTVPAPYATIDGAIEGQTATDAVLDTLTFVPCASSATAYAASTPSLDNLILESDGLRGDRLLAGSRGIRGNTWIGPGSSTSYYRCGADGARRDTTSNAVSTASGFVPFGDTAGGPIEVSATIANTISASAVAGQVGLGLAIGNQQGINYLVDGGTPDSLAWAVALVIRSTSASTGSGPREAVHIAVAGTTVTTSTGISVPAGLLTGRAQLSVTNTGSITSRWLQGGPGTTGGAYPLTNSRSRPAGPALFAGFYSHGGSAGGSSPGTTVVADFMARTTAEPDHVLPAYYATATIASDRQTRSQPNTSEEFPMPVFRGDRPFLAPSGPAGATSRLLVATAGRDIRTGTEGDVGEFAVELYATPRWLQIPDGS